MQDYRAVEILPQSLRWNSARFDTGRVGRQQNRWVNARRRHLRANGCVDVAWKIGELLVRAKFAHVPKSKDLAISRKRRWLVAHSYFANEITAKSVLEVWGQALRAGKEWWELLGVLRVRYSQPPVSSFVGAEWNRKSSSAIFFCIEFPSDFSFLASVSPILFNIHFHFHVSCSN